MMLLGAIAEFPPVHQMCRYRILSRSRADETGSERLKEKRFDRCVALRGRVQRRLDSHGQECRGEELERIACLVERKEAANVSGKCSGAAIRGEAIVDGLLLRMKNGGRRKVDGSKLGPIA